jgi:hypothetical protein
VFQVVTTWCGVVVFPFLLVGFTVGILRIDITAAMEWWREHLYFQAYFEALVAGSLPLLFVLISRESLSQYGVSRKVLARSITLSLLVAAVFGGVSFLRTGEWISYASFDAHLKIPWNLWYALIGGLANGPLEMFFFVWLVVKTDHIFKSEKAVLSWGFLGTTVLFGLVHVITTQSIVNALYVVVIFFLLGVIYKYTRNAVGPMIGWTLINGMVWAFVELLWS